MIKTFREASSERTDVQPFEVFTTSAGRKVTDLTIIRELIRLRRLDAARGEPLIAQLALAEMTQDFERGITTYVCPFSVDVDRFDVDLNKPLATHRREGET